MLTGSATLDPTYPLHNSFGAMLIGIIISAVLHGICLLQAFLFFQKFKQDAWYNKAMVLATVSFDAIHLAMVTHGIYYYVIQHYNDPKKLLIMVWSFLIEVLPAGFNAGIVQAFFAYRVWQLSKGNRVLTGIIALLILGNTTAGVVWVVLAMGFKTYEQLLAISPLSISINVVTTVTDLFIAASLCFLLHNSRTGFRRSDTIINRLMIFVVNTGMLTSCFALAALFCLVVSPRSLIYATFYFCIGRLYTNSLLATMNSRRSMTGGIDDNTTDHAMHSMPTSSGSATMLGSTNKRQNICIRIDTTAESKEDPPKDMSYIDMERQVGDSEDDSLHARHTKGQLEYR